MPHWAVDGGPAACTVTVTMGGTTVAVTVFAAGLDVDQPANPVLKYVGLEWHPWGLRASCAGWSGEGTES
jgi:hypothetical protein